jgi:hypothetical protein
MDTNTALLGTGTSGTILTVLYIVYKAVVGKRCRSSCCGRDLEMGVMVDNMTPPHRPDAPHFEVQNPARNNLPISVVVP